MPQTKEQRDAWRASNPDYQRQWRLKHRDRLNKKARDHRVNNVDAERAYNRAWRAKHPEKAAEAARRHRVKYPRRAKTDHLKNAYGLSETDYMQMELRQNCVCAICQKLPTGRVRGGHPRALSVDHDHVTGKVRALLCNGCNSALGNFKDDCSLLEAAINYLKYHAGDPTCKS